MQNNDKNAAVIRVMLAKIGLDGHDRGIKVVARALRDAGMDVVYTGLHRTPEEVVDILGISLLSGAHMHIFPKVLELLKDKEAEDMIVAGGGVIPDDDVKELYQMGVHKILLQDTPPQEIIDSFRQMVADRGSR